VELIGERRAVRIDEDDPEEDLAVEQPPRAEAIAEPAEAREPAVEPRGQLPTGPSASNTAEETAQYPIPPTVSETVQARAVAVPTWSLRAPGAIAPPSAAPSSVADFTLDPLLLRRRVTIRSGASTLTVDEAHLAVRTWWRHSAIPWSEIHGFELRFDGAAAQPRNGRLVALTSGGPVELSATKRPVSELRHLHALLDAYRQRARLFANR
jgi:hypothetical protein